MGGPPWGGTSKGWGLMGKPSMGNALLVCPPMVYLSMECAVMCCASVGGATMDYFSMGLASSGIYFNGRWLDNPRSNYLRYDGGGDIGLCLEKIWFRCLSPQVSGLESLCQDTSSLGTISLLGAWSPPLNDAALYSIVGSCVGACDSIQLVVAAWPNIRSPPLNDAAHSSYGRPFNLFHYLISKSKTPRIDGFGFTPNALTRIQDALQHLGMLDEHGVRLLDLREHNVRVLIGEDDYQAEVEWNVEVIVYAPEPIARNVAAGVQVYAAGNHHTR